MGLSVVEDIISTGADTSGANYISTSSFVNGSKVRGDIITDSGSSTLVGYVNGQPYYGPYHIHPTKGVKMVGIAHTSSPHEIIYDTPEQSFTPSIIGVASTTIQVVTSDQPTITSTSTMTNNTSTTPTPPPSSPPPSAPPSGGGGYGGGY